MKVVFLLLAYLIGAIPFSYYLAKLKGIDLLAMGSGNSGATNVYRTAGLPLAILAFLADMGKGYLVLWLAISINNNELYLIMVAVLVILGHTFTPFLNFKGGKGVATGVGVLFFISPFLALIGFVTEIALIFITKYVAVASIIACLLVAILSFLPVFEVTWLFRWFIGVVVLYIIYKHKNNIKRLAQGKESKIIK